MGVAAYNRGTALIRAQHDAESRLPEMILMDDLSNLPKVDHAKRPFGPINFVAGHGGWWAECPVTGFGYWYPTLRLAVRSWLVVMTGYENGTFTAIPT